MTLCVCGSQLAYSQCCEPFLMKNAFPDSPEQLMRSRFTAYAQGNVDYIFETMDGLAVKDFDKEQAKESSKHIHWEKLHVISSSKEKDTGKVEFIAHFSLNGKRDFVYEISEFILKNNRWYYVDGYSPKIGRNEECPCKSGKKFKKCCG